MNPLHSFVNSQLAGAIGLAVLHSLWQGALAASLLCAVVVAARSPRIRYVAACVAMLLLVVSFGATLAHFWPAAPHASQAIKVAALRRWISAPAVVSPAATRLHLADVAPWLAPFWLVGVCLIFASRLAGCFSVWRMRRRGVCSAPEHWQHELARLAALLHIARPVQFLESCFAEAPIVLGHLRPAILMPLGLLSGLPPAQIEAILLHELAHIRRSDYLVNVLQRFVEALLFYHPAVWWISGVMRCEREKCCDDAVVSISRDQHEYARALAALEQNRLAIREAAVAATGGSLMNRVRRLLAPPAPTSAWAPLLAAAILLAAVAVSAATWRSHSPSQSQQTQTPAQVSYVSASPDSQPSIFTSKPEVIARIHAANGALAAVLVRQTQANANAQNPDQQAKEKAEQDAKQAAALKRQAEENSQNDQSAKEKAEIIARLRAEKSELAAINARLAQQPGQDQDQLNKEKAELIARVRGESSQLAALDAREEQERAQYKEQLAKQKADQDAALPSILEDSAQEKAEIKAKLDAEQAEHYAKEAADQGRYADWLNEDVIYIIDDAERAAYLALKSDEERDKFIKEFWQRRGSVNGQPTDDVKAEHYRRIAYANQHFRPVSSDGVPGWKTDRGHMYIVYGPPDQIDSHPKNSDGAYGKELWLYRHLEGLGDNLTFSFVDRTGSGDYRLAPSPASNAMN